MTVDEGRLNEFLGRFVGDLGATVAAGAVVLGDRLGLYKGLAAGPATAAELAERTGTDTRYVTEWLRGQAAGGYVTYEAGADRYSLTEEQAFALTDPDGPVFLPGAFQLALGALKAEPRIAEAFRSGAGLGWGEQDADVFDGCERTGTDTRYVTEWLRGQAAGGYVTYEAGADRYSLTEEQAFALTDPDGPVFLPGAFQLALGALKAEPRIAEAFRSGAGLGWGEQDADVFDGCERFFRPGYAASLTSAWIPALDGVEAKLQAGASVADVGCGHGASTVLMAQAYPASRFAGSDLHEGSIERARKRAADAGVSDRVGFTVAGAQTFAGAGYDLVTTFDCVHDMGDPVGAARHVRDALAPDGTWLIVEPAAGDSVADNLNPVGRVYYSFSTFLCVPSARSQPGGYALGAQAGEAAMRQAITDAGFTRFRRAAETPFNIVYEARR